MPFKNFSLYLINKTLHYVLYKFFRFLFNDFFFNNFLKQSTELFNVLLIINNAKHLLCLLYVYVCIYVYVYILTMLLNIVYKPNKGLCFKVFNSFVYYFYLFIINFFWYFLIFSSIFMYIFPKDINTTYFLFLFLFLLCYTFTPAVLFILSPFVSFHTKSGNFFVARLFYNHFCFCFTQIIIVSR